MEVAGLPFAFGVFLNDDLTYFRRIFAFIRLHGKLFLKFMMKVFLDLVTEGMLTDKGVLLMRSYFFPDRRK